MPKTIVILCDGTSNEISEDRTNILRLYGALTKSEDQVVYYDPGVGTFGAANAWSYYYRKAIEIWGLATGWGLDQNVKEAYRFLVENFDDGTRADGEDVEPDRLFFFGFSRGAYTARVLAGFIHAIGLIRPVNLNLLDYAYSAYKGVSKRSRSDDDDRDVDALSEVRLYERILAPRRPAIRCLGLFDTVGSVIEWGRFGPRFRTHAYTETNQSVEAVRHAVAIDERRTMFRPQLWPDKDDYWGGPCKPKIVKKQDVEEVWFSGVHSDVGGGLPEKVSGLAKIPLDWLITETKKLGLAYQTPVINKIVLGKSKAESYVKPDPLAEKNESMNWAWKVIEFLPRRVPTDGHSCRASLWGCYLPRCERRWIASAAKVHKSVFERRGTAYDYDQRNIPNKIEKV
ncbi:MAG: DUF2235 domain-containing protein [Geminicoccaceae bacterium]